MKSFVFRLCLLACPVMLCCEAVARQDDAFDPPGLAPLEIVYDVRHGTFASAKGTLKLDVDGNRLDYALTIVPTGLTSLFAGAVDVTARMRLDKERIVAEEYIKKYRGNPAREERYRFDTQKSSVEVLHKERMYTLETPHGAFDEASVQLQLILDVQQHGGPWYYTVTSNGKVKRYRFSEIGREPVDSAFGRIETIKIQRARLRDTGKEEIDYCYWLSPAHRYLPVRAEQLSDEKVKRKLTARSISFR